MENHNFLWENPLLMAIFNSYVKLPEGTRLVRDLHTDPSIRIGIALGEGGGHLALVRRAGRAGDAAFGNGAYMISRGSWYYSGIWTLFIYVLFIIYIYIIIKYYY